MNSLIDELRAVAGEDVKVTADTLLVELTPTFLSGVAMANRRALSLKT